MSAGEAIGVILDCMHRFVEDVSRDPAERRGLEIIGQVVLRARIAARLTQRQLGYRVGLNQSTLSRLERGRLRAMRMVTLARVFGTLNLRPDVVLPGEPPSSTRRLPGERGI